MGKNWDNESVAFSVDYWKDVLRVLKPGAHGVVAGGTRTHHRLGTALEDAGFEIRDSILWIHGQGFPKSLDVSKAIDKMAGAERAVVGRYQYPDGSGERQVIDSSDSALVYGNSRPGGSISLTAPATAAAKQWQGWGTALKPATEVWWLVRKPLDSPNVASNVLKHGTGALNVDGCRVGTGADKGVWPITSRSDARGSMAGPMSAVETDRAAGRWPANLVLSHSERCRPVGVRKVRTSDLRRKDGSVNGSWGTRGVYGGANSEGMDKPNYADPDGTETVPAWDCATDGSCPVYELDRQSIAGGIHGAGSERTGGAVQTNDGGLFGVGNHPGNGTRIGDSGGASRFFPTFRYEPKASTAERNQGLSQGYLNSHPTVKSVELMRWLCRLVTPPGGIVLDPFMGSGSTGVAARLEGFRFIGIEKDAESYETARRRLQWAVHEPGLFDDEEVTR